MKIKIKQQSSNVCSSGEKTTQSQLITSLLISVISHKISKGENETLTLRMLDQISSRIGWHS